MFPWIRSSTSWDLLLTQSKSVVAALSFVCCDTLVLSIRHSRCCFVCFDTLITVSSIRHSRYCSIISTLSLSYVPPFLFSGAQGRCLHEDLFLPLGRESDGCCSSFLFHGLAVLSRSLGIEATAQTTNDSDRVSMTEECAKVAPFLCS